MKGDNELSTQTLETALRHLPHGPEFRFIDRLIELDPGRSGVGEYRLRGDEAFLRGHFPGTPILPGVILIEAAAQLAGIVAQSSPEHPCLKDLKLSAVRTAKILGTIVPGDTMLVHASIAGRLGPLIQASCRITHNDTEILTTSLVLSGV